MLIETEPRNPVRLSAVLMAAFFVVLGAGSAHAQSMPFSPLPAPPSASPYSPPPSLDPFGAGPPGNGYGEWFELESDSADIPNDVDPDNAIQALRQRMAVEAGPDKPLTDEQKRAAALLAQYVRVEQLPRSPGDILKLLAARREPTSDTTPAADEQTPQGDSNSSAQQQFFQQVAVGNWGEVKKHLAGLPDDVAANVYNHLLVLLGQEGPTTLLPDEVLSLADAAPAELSDDQLAVLGRIVAASLQHVDAPRAMLARIAEGTQRLGGSDPKQRLAAARLLIAAGMTKAAEPYLPDLAKVLQDNDAALINLHASHLVALDRTVPGDGFRHKAWNLSQTIVAMPNVDEKQRSAALRRSLSLVPKMPDKTVDRWLRDTFTERPAVGLRVVAAVVQQVELALAEGDLEARGKALQIQRRVADQLLDHASQDDPARSTAVEMMTLGWLKEAQFAIVMADVRSRPSAFRDAVERWAGISMLIALACDDKMSPLSASELLPLCPDEAWCEAIDDDMASQLRRLNGRIAAMAADREKTFAAVRHFADQDPEFATNLAREFVQNWSVQLGGSHEDQGEDYAYTPFGGGRLPPSYHRSRDGGIPLTRAKQVRDLEEYATLLREVEQLGAPPVDEGALVAAFQACHSPAEVYREEDIEQTFGRLDELRSGIAWSLASAIRQNLARQWRQPDVQQQMNTRRTDKEQVAEVRRGYELAVRLATVATEDAKQGLDAAILLASTYFDQAEFEYGQEADLASYSTLRDLAFATYKKAAKLYASSLPDRETTDRSVGVYQRWFQSSLGASDLAYLTRQDRPARDQVEQIAAALVSLGEQEAERHLKLFGESITESTPSVPPHLKPHYLREALRVLGDHDSGNAARQRLEYYDELLHEVQLHLAVDGRVEVGHGRPFGVHLSIRSTDAMGRESDGFTRLLQKGYSQSTQEEIDHKEKIEEMLREELTKSFEIDLVRFHDPNVQPRGFGRRGWKETPLAYLLLRSKDPSIDRLPVVYVDLEFNDGDGAVLLPVRSQVALIDSRDENPIARPFREVEVKQTLDDRRLAEGAIRVEVEARAKGLIPDLDGLLDVSDGASSGFVIIQREDLGLEVMSLDTTGDEVEPVCSRRWLLDFEPRGDVPAAEFPFPPSTGSDIAMAYQRYDDADIVDTAAVVPLPSFALTQYPWWWVGSGLAGIALLGVAATVLVRRNRRARRTVEPAYRRPSPLTPFNLVVLLKQMHSDQDLGLATRERDELADTIGRLEQHYFHLDGEPGAPFEPDLTTLADRWLVRASNNGHRPASAFSGRIATE